jgi:putative endopeptidase
MKHQDAIRMARTFRHLGSFAACCALAMAAPYAQAAGQGAGVQTADMDKSIRPGDDFYLYANGTWLARTDIPADRASVGSFLTASNATEAQLNTVIADLLAKPAAPGSDAQKIRDYYRAYLDTAAIEARVLPRSSPISTVLPPSPTRPA